MSSALSKLNTILETRKNKSQTIIERCKEKNEKLMARAGRELKVSLSADGLSTMSQPHPPSCENSSGVKYVKWTSSVPKVSVTIGAELVKMTLSKNDAHSNHQINFVSSFGACTY